MRTERSKGWCCGISSRIRARGMLYMIPVLFSFIGSISLIADTDILVLGSSRSYSKDFYPSIPKSQNPFNGQLVANELRRILEGDASAGAVNVVYEDIYAVWPGPTQTYRYSLLSYCYWPDGKTNRISNVKGEAGTAWDYVIIMSDPSILINVPGVYARGVQVLTGKIRQGTATPILMMQWPHAGSSVPIGDFGEVCYRVGDSGDIAVAPAGYAWDSLANKDAGTHPTPNGAYLAAATLYSQIYNKNAKDSTYTYNDTLADHALQTVQTHKTQSHYTGHYNVPHPHLVVGLKDRVLNGENGGASGENQLMWGVQGYDGNTGLQDLMPPQVSVEMNQGAGFWLNRYMGGGDYVRAGARANIRYLLQSHFASTSDTDLIYGMDYRSASASMPYPGPLRGAFGSIQDNHVQQNLRTLPGWSLWATINEEFGVAWPFFDQVHFNRDCNMTHVSYLMTVLTGRCPIGKNGTARDQALRRLGYETAWTMSYLSLRAPGFTVHPGSVGAKTIYGNDQEEIMSVYFVNAPRSNVTVNVSVNPSTAAIVSPSVLTFDSTNHDVIRNVRVVTLPNAGLQETFRVVFGTSSSDMCFDGLNDSWEYSLKRTPAEAANDYDVIEAPVRKLSVVTDESIDIDLNVESP